MAIHHAAPGEIVNFANWAQDLPDEQSRTIVKTEIMELARIVIPSGEEYLNENKPEGPIVMQCLKGKIAFNAGGTIKELRPGQLLYLLPDEPHIFKAIEDTVALVIFIFSEPNKQ